MFSPIHCLCAILWLLAAGLVHVLLYLLSLCDRVTACCEAFLCFILFVDFV